MMRSESTKALGHPRETKLIFGALAVVMIEGSVEGGWLPLIVSYFKALSPYKIGIFRVFSPLLRKCRAQSMGECFDLVHFQTSDGQQHAPLTNPMPTISRSAPL
jgi:hypothetical protein